MMLFMTFSMIILNDYLSSQHMIMTNYILNETNTLYKIIKFFAFKIYT